MYSSVLFFHSIFRWLVLISLLYAIFRAYRGYTTHSTFTKTDNSVRHWTATIAHIQLLLGFGVYLTSPLVSYFFADFQQAVGETDTLFFGVIHMLCMLLAIVCITVGSSMAKRKQTDLAKFKTMLIWFSIALLIIFLAIPWPFSPLAHRPYFRGF